MSVDDLLTLLGDSEVLETLEISSDDLPRARRDADLLETQRNTYGIITTMKAGAVFDTFLLLPKSDQANFLWWIGMIDDAELRRDRTITFVISFGGVSTRK